MAFRKLDASQEATFDQEYVDDALWERTRPAIVPRLPASPRILDVGGGNGQFMDRMLASFPGA
ncbi:MAG: hypothetical protein ACXWG9_18120, partial [Usitatibacter sp.]